jgi:hypothetical protein
VRDAGLDRDEARRRAFVAFGGVREPQGSAADVTVDSRGSTERRST